MTTMTGHRRSTRREHLRLVTTDSPAPRPGATLPVADPTPGPRDAAEVVARFSALLPPPGEDLDGCFSLGAD